MRKILLFIFLSAVSVSFAEIQLIKFIKKHPTFCILCAGSFFMGPPLLYVWYFKKPTHPEKSNENKHYNVITLEPAQSSKTEEKKISASELAQLIYQNYELFPDKLYLSIRGRNELWKINKGVNASGSFITLYSRGFAPRNKPNKTPKKGEITNAPRNGGGALCVYSALRDHILPKIPVVTFDYPDTRSKFAFGQQTKCLRKIVEELQARPLQGIIAYGGCRGAKTWLHHLLNKSDENLSMIKALVLESPLPSLHALCDHLAQSKFNFSLASTLLYLGLRAWFSKYKAKEDNILERLKNKKFPFPILIGHLKGDPLISDKSIEELAHSLASHNDVYLLVIKDESEEIKHAKLSRSAPYQKVINAFYMKHSIPEFEPALAHEGLEILEVAKANLSKNRSNWSIYSHST